MQVETRKLRKDEIALLKEFLYEAIFIPEGVTPPPKDIVEKPELRVYEYRHKKIRLGESEKFKKPHLHDGSAVN